MDGGEECPAFIGLERPGDRQKLAVKCMGEENDQLLLKNLPEYAKAILQNNVAANTTIGVWVRDRLLDRTVNRMLLKADAVPEEDDAPEFRLIEVMMVPDEVWKVAVAAEFLERLGRRKGTTMIDAGLASATLEEFRSLSRIAGIEDPFQFISEFGEVDFSRALQA